MVSDSHREEVWYLWMVIIQLPEYDNRIPLARNQAHAQERAASALTHFPGKVVRFEHYPDGLRISHSILPGSITMLVSSSSSSNDDGGTQP